ncbi:MAG: flagellar motor protein MotB [Woeseia sp.]|nr:flagellar motor protein MotB [Woeseia sp.]MBT8096513.1 flagellar motor protein MotB [Woeseia sp.]NNE62019.1 flagellar motor protein MotB [Woeseia sp.]NNL55000.1 flagellar motor protein MotB [Woeseia sp.]
MSEPAEKPEERGVPAWVMTFADLMTLLMCFFVLLLSFSEMDVLKFKQLSGSMKNAFGVQAEIEVKSIPKGTSVIAREFSPGRPDPTALPVVRQFTIDSNKSTLDVLDKEKKLRDDMEKQAKRLRLALQEEIKNGSVSIETEGMRIIIRILEKASFDSGSAKLRPDFSYVLKKIGSMIDNNSGLIKVSGHTDNVPISRNNRQFRSNWELSSSRAVSVTHELLKTTSADAGRFTVTGHADTKPRTDNISSASRAKNRRVDISIIRGEADPISETSALKVSPVAEMTTKAIENAAAVVAEDNSDE